MPSPSPAYAANDYAFDQSTGDPAIISMWIYAGGGTSSPTVSPYLSDQWVEFSAPQGPQGIQGVPGAPGSAGSAGPQGGPGLQGPQGLPGPLGSTGPTGPTGLQGPAGPVGLQGPQGLPGSDGLQGPVGAAGSQGAQGLPGPQGLQGDSGPQGPQGLAGATGAVGPAGQTGPQGPIGLTGALGPQGQAGASGPAGPTGPAGPQGADGPQGTSGLQGDPGPQGPQGLLGNTGPAGPIGPFGPLGPLGPQGAQGLQGNPGPQGAQGLQGDPGPAGLAGPTGPQGSQGDPGPQGPQGLQGLAGNSGPQGNDGPQGPQGIQGVQGATGPQGTKGLQWTGTWNAGSAYVVDDTVGYGGSSYVAIAASVGLSPPASPASWELLVAQGAVGSQGPAGATGPAGVTGGAGPVGAMGAAGPVGATGPTGPTGPTGLTGPIGPEGARGIGLGALANLAVVTLGYRDGSPVVGPGIYTSIQDALLDVSSWCDPGGPTLPGLIENPCLIRLMPGSYVVDTLVQLLPHVHLEGAGEAATRIRLQGTGQIAFWGTGAPEDAVEIRSLTVERGPSSTPMAAIENHQGHMTLSEVTIWGPNMGGSAIHAEGGIGSTTLSHVTIDGAGVAVEGFDTPLRIEDTTIRNSDFGVMSPNSMDVTIRNSEIEVNQLGATSQGALAIRGSTIRSLNGPGIESYFELTILNSTVDSENESAVFVGAGPARIDHSNLSSMLDSAVRVQGAPFDTVYIGTTQLSTPGAAPAVAGPGAWKCIHSYDNKLDPLNSLCQ